jgi:hypothetical protein
MSGQWPTLHEAYLFAGWHPLYQTRATEKAHYPDFADAMSDVFGEALVHTQVPVAHGSTLKIDFHIGSMVPGQPGVGVEFKRPANNSDLQRAIGQLGQYQSRYGESLIVVVLADIIEHKHLQPFVHELTLKRITHVVKQVLWDEQ